MRPLCIIVVWSIGSLHSVHLVAQVSIDQEPINYNSAKAYNAVSNLQKRLDTNQTKLEFDSQHGYLASVLRHLKISPASQALVFSKTSLQRERISPRTPRAIYFNDEVYVGWCQQGSVLEIAAADPKLGMAFYTIDQRRQNAPLFVRQNDNCLQCHGSSMTRNVPGLMIRSVYTDPRGQPILRAGTYLTTHQSPLAQRWGGWYVSGTHGDQPHMGNVSWEESDDAEVEPASDAPAFNVQDLASYFDTNPYLTPHSDIVALMVLEHQVQMHNLLTDVNFKTRAALYDQRAMDQALGRSESSLSDSTQSRIRGAAEPLVRYLLFCGEATLSAPVRGSSSFREQFEAQGPRDKRGRSLRQFDLERRLFKFPCSYLIYSDAFDALPDAALREVYQRLWEVLSGQDQSKEFAHLLAEDRRSILAILQQTKEGLPEYWRINSKR